MFSLRYLMYPFKILVTQNPLICGRTIQLDAKFLNIYETNKLNLLFIELLSSYHQTFCYAKPHKLVKKCQLASILIMADYKLYYFKRKK